MSLPAVQPKTRTSLSLIHILTVLFPYATIFVAGAFVTMLFVRHGDSRPIPAKGLEALDVDD